MAVTVAFLMHLALMICMLIPKSTGQGDIPSNGTGAETANFVSSFVTAWSTMLLVIGLIVLILGGAVVTGVSLVMPISKHCAHIDTDEGIIDQGTHIAERIYSEIQDTEPPPPPPPQQQQQQQQQQQNSSQSVPDEMGFHVSVDVHDHKDEPTQTGNNWIVSTINFPFNFDPMTSSQTQDLEMADEAAGYLSGATYHKNKEVEGKVDLSLLREHQTTEFTTEALYCNAQTAVLYEEMECVEGDIIDEIDYENVTVVKTNVIGSTGDVGGTRVDIAFQGRGEYSHSPSAESEIEYLSMESFDMKYTSESYHVDGIGINPMEFSQGAANSAHQSPHNQNTLLPPTGKLDAVSLQSDLSYENVTPHLHKPSVDRCVAVNEMDKNTGKMDEYVNELDSIVKSEETECLGTAAAHDADTEDGDLYMNVPSSHLQGVTPPTSPTDEDYVNIRPEMYKHNFL